MENLKKTKRKTVVLLFSSAVSCVGENRLIFHSAALFIGVDVQCLAAITH